MTVRLPDSLSKDEWWEVISELCPDVTEEEFDRVWVVFQAMKAEEARRKALH